MSQDQPPENDPAAGGYPPPPPGQGAGQTPGGYPAAPPPYGAQPGGGYPAAPPPYGAQPGGYGPGHGGYAAMPPEAYANWGQRVGATLIDALAMLPFYVLIIIGVAILSANSTTTVDQFGNTTSEMGSGGGVGIAVMVLGYLGAIIFAIWNQIFRQGRTGWSIGKKVMKIRLVSEETGQPIGPLLTFARAIVHIVDSLPCYIGYLWPLWDAKRQTFADKIMRTVVMPAEEPPRGSTPPPVPQY